MVDNCVLNKEFANRVNSDEQLKRVEGDPESKGDIDNIRTEEDVSHSVDPGNVPKREVEHGPAASQSWETLCSSEGGYAGSDGELSGSLGPGRLYVQTTDVNIVNTVRHVSWSLRSTVRTRSTTQRLQTVDEESALALLNKPCPNYSVKCSEILKFIIKNPQTSDLKISLYMVASEGVALLKPFPTSVVEESIDGAIALTLINEEVPSVQLMQHYLKDLEQYRVSDTVVNLLHWLLVYEKEPKIMHIPSECFYSIFQKVKNGVNYQQPTHVFKLMYPRFSTAECKWRALKQGRNSTFAFYGDCLKVMHSIVHLGFYPLVYSEGLHGLGMYFYTDLQHCLEKTGDEGWCWGKSELGGQLKTVLVVEILGHPDCRTYNEYKAMTSEQKALTSGDASQELNCCFVPRAELVRIRYVLIFVQKQSKVRPAVIALRPKRTLRDWIIENKKRCLVIGSSLLIFGITAHYIYNKNIHPEVTGVVVTKIAPLTSPVSTV